MFPHFPYFPNEKGHETRRVLALGACRPGPNGPARVVFFLFRVSGRSRSRCVPASQQVGSSRQETIIAAAAPRPRAVPSSVQSAMIFSVWVIPSLLGS